MAGAVVETNPQRQSDRGYEYVAIDDNELHCGRVGLDRLEDGQDFFRSREQISIANVTKLEASVAHNVPCDLLVTSWSDVWSNDHE